MGSMIVFYLCYILWLLIRACHICNLSWVCYFVRVIHILSLGLQFVPFYSTIRIEIWGLGLWCVCEIYVENLVALSLIHFYVSLLGTGWERFAHSPPRWSCEGCQTLHSFENIKVTSHPCKFPHTHRIVRVE